MTYIIIGVVLVVALGYMVIFAMCKVAGNADRHIDLMEEEKYNKDHAQYWLERKRRMLDNADIKRTK